MLRLENEPPQPGPLHTVPHFVVGQDDLGHWLAIETHDRGGGIFKSRADALHFFDFETNHRPGTVEFAATPLRLKF